MTDPEFTMTRSSSTEQNWKFEVVSSYLKHILLNCNYRKTNIICFIAFIKD